MTENVIRKSVYLKAKPSAVWAFLTEPEKLATWFHKPDVALSEVGKYKVTKAGTDEVMMIGEVLDVSPYERLRYSFHIAPMGDAISTVTWTLEVVDGGTRLSLVHEGLPQGEAGFDLLAALDGGWDKHIASMRDEL